MKKSSIIATIVMLVLLCAVTFVDAQDEPVHPWGTAADAISSELLAVYQAPVSTQEEYNGTWTISVDQGNPSRLAYVSPSGGDGGYTFSFPILGWVRSDNHLVVLATGEKRVFNFENGALVEDDAGNESLGWVAIEAQPQGDVLCVVVVNPTSTDQLIGANIEIYTATTTAFGRDAACASIQGRLSDAEITAALHIQTIFVRAALTPAQITTEDISPCIVISEEQLDAGFVLVTGNCYTFHRFTDYEVEESGDSWTIYTMTNGTREGETWASSSVETMSGAPVRAFQSDTDTILFSLPQ
ncbi:MAG: hypothetical protein ABI721_05010 [Candidatus Dojkabacteria bacterium]